MLKQLVAKEKTTDQIIPEESKEAMVNYKGSMQDLEGPQVRHQIEEAKLD